MARRAGNSEPGLFKSKRQTHEPLAERMRPHSLEEVVGQDHLLGTGKLLSQMASSGALHSIILWGPPGAGKTTIARLLANRSGAVFKALAAVASGVADMREVVNEARRTADFEG